jgi:hypothetical protein
MQQNNVSDSILDLLYREYLPFRLYIDSAFGASTADLAKRFARPEHWIAERIEAIGLCIEKQVHLNLLERCPHL